MKLLNSAAAEKLARWLLRAPDDAKPPVAERKYNDLTELPFLPPDFVPYHEPRGGVLDY